MIVSYALDGFRGASARSTVVLSTSTSRIARFEHFISIHPYHWHDDLMKLYLIRHGETVDNVAGLFAGVRDSALTNYGVDQARCLGEHFSKRGIKVTHLFASPLQRAVKTAEAVLKAQYTLPDVNSNAGTATLQIVQVAELVEQDFGFYEGKPVSSRRQSDNSNPAFVDAESKESLAKRADAFLDQHLVPLINRHERNAAASGLHVVVVSHGIFLSHLWRRLLVRLPKKSLTVAPEVTAARGNLILEHLGGWSNTGYLELALTRDDMEETSRKASAGEAAPLPQGLAEDLALPTPEPPVQGADAVVPLNILKPKSSDASPMTAVRILRGWSTAILAVDNKQHLVGLKRQRGGIGRLAHDAGQKKLDAFFKRQKPG
ncbi:hypothetical protein BAUCODRAFT_35085 [Baudoinia panamericana UAMH 10762]|uniref:Phosphoglycerate mutase-like protein n=1 Tax=Baudoinia panamericana (strain UAMH 10762) TaxID=717646 RepID=M2MET5_BAUPA|nr:uncharacterized protein BAUCODRAFT_35085 [Baudoinia panamericana UAMH 10762]EMC95096.1 hypothetical protein BAUCODRAFT_35085 [Baudoinia panamericana UAMH 10762]